MSRDRLAVSRARRQIAGARAHELDDLSSTSNINGTANTGTTSDFFAEVSSIQEGIERINANVHQIAILHTSILNSMGDEQSPDVAHLEQLAADTRTLSNNLKKKIQALGRPLPGPDAQMRKNRIAFVQSKFIDAIQNYQRVEQEHRIKARQRVERQLKIVKPDATPEEVAAVAEGGGQQIFAQALASSTRYEDSQIAYREVRERQQEIRKMEETLMELARLFVDMGILIEQQEVTVDNIETTAAHVEHDVEKASGNVWKAVLSARRYRKGRRICFGIFMAILFLIVVAIAIWLGIAQPWKHT